MNSKYSRSYYRCELIGVSVGAAAGGLLAPPESRRLGLALGAIIGGLLATAWKFWILKHPRSEKVFSIGWFGHLFYLLAIVLCVYMLGIAVRTFLFDPDKLVVALAGMLFFGAGAVALGFLWWSDFTNEESTVARTDAVLAAASFALALDSLLVMFLGNVMFGGLGTVFFFLCGVAALRKARARQVKILLVQGLKNYARENVFRTA